MSDINFCENFCKHYKNDTQPQRVWVAQVKLYPFSTLLCVVGVYSSAKKAKAALVAMCDQNEAHVKPDDERWQILIESKHSTEPIGYFFLDETARIDSFTLNEQY